MAELPPPPAPSGRKPDDASKKEVKEPKKPRSPIERMIVWGLILVMGGVAGYEYSQRRNYERHLAVLTEALDKSEGETEVKYADIASKLSDKPSITDGSFGGATYDMYTWKWGGIREYKIELFVSKTDNRLIAIKQQDMK